MSLPKRMAIWLPVGHLLLFAVVLGTSPSVPSDMLRLLDAPVDGLPPGSALSPGSVCFDCPIVIFGKVLFSPWAPLPNKILVLFDYPSVRATEVAWDGAIGSKSNRFRQSIALVVATTVQWLVVGLLVDVFRAWVARTRDPSRR
jgi:hypothetical protein